MAELAKYRWDDMPREDLSAGLTRRLVTGDQVMIAHVYFTKGAEVPRHRHHNEQLTYILEGALQFWFGEDDEETHTVRAGEVLVIPSTCRIAPWRSRTRSTSTCSRPPRQDWLDGTDAYLRGGATS